MEKLIEARGIVKNFDVPVLQGIDLEITSESRLVIEGASGAGKSTLLHILGGLDPPTEGSVLFRGNEIYSQKDRELSRLRNESIGFIFQFHHLLPEFDVVENVMMPLLVRDVGRREARKRAEAILEKVGLQDRRRHRPTELSGGEQQRVAVARAVVGEPQVLFADEPTGNLDRENGDKVFELILDRTRQRPMALVIVTHNEGLARQIPTRLRIADGRLTSHP